MADYEQTRTVDGGAAELYEYLADPSHLTDYVATMVKAQVLSGEHLHVAADVSRGHEEGEATFRADAGARRLSWGGTGGHGYSGWLQVSDGADADTASVTIHLSTSDEDNRAEIERAIDQTLSNIAGRMSHA